MKGNSLNKKNITITILILLMLVLNFTVIAANDLNRAIHLSWQNDPATTMTVMWRSEPGAEGTLEYGIDSNYTHSLESEINSYKFGRTEVCWHIVEIIGLEPDTTYHYKVSTSEPWESEDYTFKTALPPRRPQPVLRHPPGQALHGRPEADHPWTPDATGPKRDKKVAVIGSGPAA